MEFLKLNINVGGGLINHIAIKNDKVYRFVEDGLMIYKYTEEDLDTLIDKILEQEYDDNYIETYEYELEIFNQINEDKIFILIEKYNSPK